MYEIIPVLYCVSFNNKLKKKIKNHLYIIVIIIKCSPRNLQLPASGINIMALALDLTRRILSLPYNLYKLDRITDFDLFVMMATLEAIKEKVLHASAPHAPYVSTAKGVHRHPSSEHLASYLECLRTSAAHYNVF